MGSGPYGGSPAGPHLRCVCLGPIWRRLGPPSGPPRVPSRCSFTSLAGWRLFSLGAGRLADKVLGAHWRVVTGLASMLTKRRELTGEQVKRVTYRTRCEQPLVATANSDQRGELRKTPVAS